MSDSKQQSLGVLTIVVLIVGILLIMLVAGMSEENSAQLLRKETSMSACIASAEREFRSTFEINSSPAPQPGKPSVRTWNNSSIAESTQKALEAAKDSCIKQFKD